MKIKLLLTGGTIDQSFAPTSPKVLMYDKTHIHEMLNQARVRLNIEINELMLANSEDIDNDGLEKIVTACREATEDKIVITHGTNTMVETAELIANSINNKVIVFTGSIVPFAIGNSDALFNLGSAFMAVQLLEPGVYITMNGKVFKSDDVKKNFDIGEFQSKIPD